MTTQAFSTTQNTLLASSCDTNVTDCTQDQLLLTPVICDYKMEVALSNDTDVFHVLSLSLFLSLTLSKSN